MNETAGIDDFEEAKSQSEISPPQESAESITGTIALTTGELLITNDLSIAGPGATNLALSGQGATRVFEIGSNATVSISGLTIRNGRAPTPGGSGGGFYNAGSLTLNACILTGNGGGGNFYPGGDGGSGGGIYNSGAVSLSACTLSNNYGGDADFDGGGVHFGAGAENSWCFDVGGGVCTLGGGG